MDSFEWNKVIGAVLGTVVFIFVIRIVAEYVYEPEHPEKPGYAVEGVVEDAKPGAAAAPAEEVAPDWGTVLAKADLNAGKDLSGRCVQCHDFSKGGPNKIGPELFAVVERPKAHNPGFSYSSALKSKGGNWTYDDLFHFLKTPAMFVPGTKMSFAGIRNEQDRINLIAWLHSNADTPAPVPAPKPAAEAPAAADGAAAPAAPDAAAPAPAH